MDSAYIRKHIAGLLLSLLVMGYNYYLIEAITANLPELTDQIRFAIRADGFKTSLIISYLVTTGFLFKSSKSNFEDGIHKTGLFACGVIGVIHFLHFSYIYIIENLYRIILFNTITLVILIVVMINGSRKGILMSDYGK